MLDSCFAEHARGLHLRTDLQTARAALDAFEAVLGVSPAVLGTIPIPVGSVVVPRLARWAGNRGLLRFGMWAPEAGTRSTSKGLSQATGWKISSEKLRNAGGLSWWLF